MDVFCLLLDQRVDHIVGGNRSDEPLLVVDHRNREQVVLCGEASDLLAVGRRLHGHQVPMRTHVGDGCALLSGEELAERDDADEALVGGHDVDGVDGLAGWSGPADVIHATDRAVRPSG